MGVWDIEREFLWEKEKETDKSVCETVCVREGERYSVWAREIEKIDKYTNR